MDHTTAYINDGCEIYFNKEDNKSVAPIGVRGHRFSYDLSEEKTMQMRGMLVPSRDGCYYSRNRKLSVEDYQSFTKQTNCSVKTR